ncbi:MAG: hypothetical protein LH654_01035, partial [Thermoleophilia bacterium]|nr:hypothetical protein [Thermoleophilia bacterium]
MARTPRVTRVTRVGINGFGRVGRLALRAGWGRNDLALVHVNEIKGGTGTGAHLLEFDSVHGRWAMPIASNEHNLAIDGRRLGWSDVSEPTDVDWEGLGVDVALECSGKFRTGSTLKPHLERGGSAGPGGFGVRRALAAPAA